MADCLSPDDLAAYVRGRGDARAVEAHVRDCPGCAMELLLAREALRDLRPASQRRKRPAARSAAPYIVAAAALLVAVAGVLLLQPPKPAPVAVRPPQPAPLPVPPPAPLPPPPPLTKQPPNSVNKPEETPAPEPPPAPKPAPVPAPAPKPLPTPPPAEPPKPVPPPRPTPPPPTTVERPVVARVTHAVGAPADVVGRRIFAGETVATGRSETLALAVDGLGRVWLREGSRAEFAGAELTLHEGGLMAEADVPATFRTPISLFDVGAGMVDLQSSKTGSELSVVAGRARAGDARVDGPGLLSVRAGRAPEARPLEPGFAGWIPDKLATKRFSAWLEAETFKPVGFRATEFDGASGDQAMVQVEERAMLALKAALPARGRHVLWLRARQYVAKPVIVGLGLNGADPVPVRLEGQEGRPWRWIGPVPFTADRLDLLVAALTPHFLRPDDERRSFPVTIDAAFVSSDVKAVPPERLPERPIPYSFHLESP